VAPDEGNMHTLLHWGTEEEQKEQYLRPLCEGTKASCFAMTEPGVAGSDPAAGPRATCSASPASGRPAWPTACAGSNRPRWRWT
jgi:alkylation response protein AidB-like acyl-CoA dehydrogenase